MKLRIPRSSKESDCELSDSRQERRSDRNETCIQSRNEILPVTSALRHEDENSKLHRESGSEVSESHEDRRNDGNETPICFCQREAVIDQLRSTEDGSRRRVVKAGPKLEQLRAEY